MLSGPKWPLKTISRKDALRLGLARYFTGKPCKHGHIAERYLPNGECLDCTPARVARWQKSRKGKNYQWQYHHTPVWQEYQREYDRARPRARPAHGRRPVH
jgi:hypothetical protein